MDRPKITIAVEDAPLGPVGENKSVGTPIKTSKGEDLNLPQITHSKSWLDYDRIERSVPVRMRSRSVGGEIDAPLSTTPINNFIPPTATESTEQKSSTAERPLFAPIEALKEGTRDGNLQDYRSSSFYKNAAFIKGALEKRPSIVDIQRNLERTASWDDTDLIMAIQATQKKPPKLLAKMAEKADSKKKEPKLATSAGKGEYIDLAFSDFKNSFSYKESYHPNTQKEEKLKQILHKKTEAAIELSHSFWEESKSGYRDLHKYEQEKQYEDERWGSGQLVSHEIDLNVIWKNVDVSEEASLCHKQLKFLIRRGVPDRLRRKIWKSVTGAKEFKKAHPTLYEDAVKNAFGENVPTKHIKVPTFGGILSLDDHYLTEEGKLAVKRILCIVALENPNLDYCPALPDLVAILANFLNEDEIYIVVHLLLKTSKDNSWYFTTSNKSFTHMLFMFNDIIRKRLCKDNKRSTSQKRVYDYMVSLQIDPVEAFSMNWFSRLFVGVLPYQCVLRVFDAYLDEGFNVLFRVGLGLMKLHHKELLATKSKEDFMKVLKNCCNNTWNQNQIMKMSLALDLSRDSLYKIEKKNKKKVKEVKELPAQIYYRPKIRQPSGIIADEIFEVIWSFLPGRFRIMDPQRLFYSGKDGFSMKTLLKKSADHKTTILLLKTKKGAVFGAFLGDEWKVNGKEYYGSGDSFVFSLMPNEHKYPWSGANNYFTMIMQNSISIGGGNGMAIYLNEELLIGKSQKSDTFKNEPLHCEKNENFEISAIEVYTFV